MTRYFDASALVKRYVRESGSTTVRRLLASGTAATSRLSEVEVSSGIVRRAREGAFTIQQRDRMLAALVRDVPALAMVEMTPEITSDARTLLLRHPLRTGDAIQCARATPSSLRAASICSGSLLSPFRSSRSMDDW